jgi:hypothetical protein
MLEVQLMLDGILPENVFVEIPVPKTGSPFQLEEPMHPLQLEQFRKATPGEKFAQVAAMRSAGIALQKIGLRMRNPDWSAEKLEREARRRMMYART